MHGLKALFRRELAGYFSTPLAYVFVVVFLMVSGLFTFYLGNFYERGQADLDAFFMWHPWLYLFLIPAIAMRLWAEERKSGTLELLMTLPVSTQAMVAGKFLAAWCFAGLALLLTFPMWITVNYLGDPDNGIIVASYIGSFLMAGGYLAIGAAISACTKSQVIAFVISVVVCFLFTLSGFPLVINAFAAWAPQAVVETIASFSFYANFQEITKGVLELSNLVYFLALVAFWLYANMAIITLKKG